MIMLAPLGSAIHSVDYFVSEQRFLNDNSFPPVLAWSPDGSRIATGANLDILILNSTDGKVQSEFASLSGGIDGICWSPDGKQLASIQYGNAVSIWDAASCTEVLRLNVTEGMPSAVAWSPEGGRIATRVGERAISILSAINGTRLVSMPLEPGIAGKGCLRWSPDGSRLLDVGINHVFIFNSTTGAKITDIGADRQVLSADWAPSGESIAVPVHDETLAIYDATTAVRLNPPQSNQTNPVEEYSVAWSPAGDRIATLGHSGTLTFWDGGGAEVQSTALGPDDSGSWLAWSPDGHRLASVYRGEIRIWGTEGPSLVASMEAQPDVTTSGETSNLTIRVTDADGNPVAGAELYLFDRFGSCSMASFDGNGTYLVLFTADWMWNDEMNVTMRMVVRKDGVGSTVATCIISINGKPPPPVNNSLPVIVNVSAADGTEFLSSMPVNMSAQTYDADGDSLTMVWYVNGTKTTAPEYSGILGVGNYSVRLLVTDGKANVETSFNISVVEEFSGSGTNNTTKPAPSSNHAPVIQNATIFEGLKIRAATVFLSVDSSDSDGDTLTYTWTVDGTVAGTERDLSYRFAPGNHTVTVGVSDGMNVTTQTYHIIVEKKSSPNAPAAVPGIGFAGALCVVGIILLRRLRLAGR